MTKYAGFWKRFAAAFIDGIILGIFQRIFKAIVNSPPIIMIVAVVVAWLYGALMESSPKQATLGKQAVGIIVTDLDGKQISFLRATGRYFAKYLSMIILFIGYIMAGFTEKKQALHDMVAGTLVINK
jgi:uncharacterized RDD family membrane protein YckC